MTPLSYTYRPTSATFCDYYNFLWPRTQRCQTSQGTTLPLTIPSPDRAISSPFSTPPFKFIVEDVQYLVHEKLVANVSKPLERLMHMDMKEKSQGFVKLDGVDRMTFERFVHWIYDGRYETSAPITISAESPVGRAGTVQRKDDQDGRPKLSTKLPTRDYEYQRMLVVPSWRRTASEQSTTSIMHPPSRLGSPTQVKNLDFTDVMHAHARLYVFADEKQVIELKDLVISRLYSIYCDFEEQQTWNTDIIGLLKFTYENTSPSTENGMEPLREFAMDTLERYEARPLMENTALMALMIEEGGDLLKDFMDFLQRHMNQMEVELKEYKMDEGNSTLSG